MRGQGGDDLCYLNLLRGRGDLHLKGSQKQRSPMAALCRQAI